MVVAIRAGWVWDGTGREAIRDGVVVVDGERIAAVGPAVAVEGSPGGGGGGGPEGFFVAGVVGPPTHVKGGAGGEARRDGVVGGDGERSAAVGPAVAIEVSPGAEVVERPDEFLMPGLIDAHTHVTVVPGLGDQIGQLRQPIERQTMRGVGNL